MISARWRVVGTPPKEPYAVEVLWRSRKGLFGRKLSETKQHIEMVNMPFHRPLDAILCYACDEPISDEEAMEFARLKAEELSW